MDLNSTIFGQFISFFLFVWFCMKYIWPNIINMIEKRKKEIHLSIQKIEYSNQKIEEAKINAKKIIYQSQEEAKKIIELAKKNKLIILEQAKLVANQEKKKIILQTYHEINIQTEKIKSELIKETSLLALKMAKKIIQGSIKNKVLDNDIIKKLTINL